MSAIRGKEAIEDLSGFRITRYEHEPFLPGIGELRDQCTAYDAAYLVLAEALGATLLTRAHGLAWVASKMISVELL